MKCSFDILGIGTTAVDDIVLVDHYPAADEKVSIKGKSRSYGGLVGAALAAAVKLGKRCTYAGVLGHDELSKAMREALVGVGIDVSQIISREEAKPIHSIIITDITCHTRNIFFAATDLQVFPAEMVTKQLISSAKVLLVDSYGIDTALRAARIAGSLSVPVVADMEEPNTAGAQELMTMVDHFIVPKQFAQAFTQESDPAKMVSSLHAICNRQCTAVTCGSDGCFYIDANSSSEVKHFPAFKIEPMETTGCGDVFHGAYAAGLVSGLNIIECIRQASAAAAFYGARPNGWEYLPNEKDIC